MSAPNLIAATLFLYGLFATTTYAQVCNGTPGVRAGNAILGAGYSKSDGANGFELTLAALGTQAFWRAGIGLVNYDAFSGSTVVLGGSTGYQLPIGATGDAQLCPYVSGSLGFGPNDINGSGTDMSTQAIGAGISAGSIVLKAQYLSLIPSVDFGYMYSRAALKNGTNEISESETYGSLGIGLGIVLAQRLTIRPSITIPVGLKEAENVFGINMFLSLKAPH